MIQTSLLIFDPFKNKNFHHASTNPLYLFYKGDVRPPTRPYPHHHPLHTHPMTSPFFFLVRRVDSLHTLEWRLIGHPSHCADSPDISITRQRP